MSPWQHDGHPDHEAAGRAAATVCHAYDSRLVEYPIGGWGRFGSNEVPDLEVRRLSLSPLLRARKAYAIPPVLRERGAMPVAGCELFFIDPRRRRRHTRRHPMAGMVPVRGTLDAESAPRLRSTLSEQVANSQPDSELTVDLAEVTSVDAHGLTVLLTAADAVRSAGVSIRFVGLPDTAADSSVRALTRSLVDQ